MLSKGLRKAMLVALAGVTVLGTVDAASAASSRNRYTHSRSGVRNYGYGYNRGYRGPGVGAAVAGAALGVIGAAAAGVAADRYYNGYPAYSYGPGYRGGYGYDYLPNRGYYGPY